MAVVDMLAAHRFSILIVNETVTQYWTTHRIRAEGQGPEGPFVVSVDKPFALIGSHNKADLKLRGSNVARRHFFALATDAGIHILDLAEGRRQKKQQGFWLDPEQVITVGDYQFTLGFVDRELPEQPPVKNLLASSADRPFPMIQCKSEGSIIGRPYLNRPLALIGRTESCKFQFTTRSVSPEHCAFYQQDGRLWIIDFQSTRKTKKENVPVECAQLYDGSSLQIGRVEIEVGMNGPSSGGHYPAHSPSVSESNNTGADSYLPALTIPGDSARLSTVPDDQDEDPRDNVLLVQSELEQARKELEVLKSSREDSQIQVQRLQAELDSALEQIGRQDLDQQTREENWRETEEQLTKQHESWKEQRDQGRHELALAKTEIANLLDQIAALEIECQAHENLPAEMETMKTALQGYTEKLETTEKQLAEQLRLVDERDLHIEEQQKKIESHTQELERLTHDHEVDSQNHAKELHSINLEINQRSKRLDQAETEIESREVELSTAIQALQRDREQVLLDQQSVEQFSKEQLEAEQRLSQLQEMQLAAKSEQQVIQEQLEQRQEQVEKQVAELNAQRETLQQEAQQTEERLRQTALQLDQREAELTQQVAKLAQSSEEANLSHTEEEQRISLLLEKLNKEREELKGEQSEWQSLVSEKEKEMADRDSAIQAAEQGVKEDQTKIDADRRELEHYFSIDQAQRHVLANLNAIQKEKPSTNRFWSWLGFPFRNP